MADNLDINIDETAPNSDSPRSKTTTTPFSHEPSKEVVYEVSPREGQSEKDIQATTELVAKIYEDNEEMRALDVLTFIEHLVSMESDDVTVKFCKRIYELGAVLDPDVSNPMIRKEDCHRAVLQWREDLIFYLGQEGFDQDHGEPGYGMQCSNRVIQGSVDSGICNLRPDEDPAELRHRLHCLQKDIDDLQCQLTTYETKCNHLKDENILLKNQIRVFRISLNELEQSRQDCDALEIVVNTLRGENVGVQVQLKDLSIANGTLQRENDKLINQVNDLKIKLKKSVLKNESLVSIQNERVVNPLQGKYDEVLIRLQRTEETNQTLGNLIIHLEKQIKDLKKENQIITTISVLKEKHANNVNHFQMSHLDEDDLAEVPTALLSTICSHTDESGRSLEVELADAAKAIMNCQQTRDAMTATEEWSQADQATQTAALYKSTGDVSTSTEFLLQRSSSEPSFKSCFLQSGLMTEPGTPLTDVATSLPDEQKPVGLRYRRTIMCFVFLACVVAIGVSPHVFMSLQCTSHFLNRRVLDCSPVEAIINYFKSKEIFRHHGRPPI